MSPRTCHTVDHSLVGLWFHKLTKKGITWQGQVVERLEHGYYRVQLYEWFVGAESNDEIVHTNTIKNWLFYATNRAMRDAYVRFHCARINAEASAEVERVMTRLEARQRTSKKPVPAGETVQ